MATVRRLEEHEWSPYRSVRLRALADSPDSFGSTLSREQERSESEWAERVAAGAASDLDLPLVALDGDEVVGLAWGKIDPSSPDEAHVFQMWVAPHVRGQGLGFELLSTIVEWARGRKARCVLLGATCGNTPAQQLYRRAGFQPVGDPDPLRPGSDLMSQEMCLEL